MRENSLVTDACAQSKLILSADQSLPQDRTTDALSLSQSGTIFAPLTEADGGSVLTWFVEDFPVKTSALQVQEAELPQSDLDSGEKWPVWFAKYDHNSSSWKTRQPSLFAALERSLETWPRWGTMRIGECLAQEIIPAHIGANDCFSWLTPLAAQARRGWGITLNINPEASSRCGERIRRNTLRDISEYGWKLNPFAHEWLMAWPHGWTDLNPLATVNVQSWLLAHSKL